jgi:hypothetical protein
VTAARDLVRSFVLARVQGAAANALTASADECARGTEPVRFGGLLSLASRHVPRGPLAPSARELAAANELCPGWNPERWTLLDAARAWLVLARPDLAQPSAVVALEECFAYADVGESCALHRVIALLPGPERFVWRAGEGCRSSMRAVYEAAACDTPFPARHFDDLAWRQLVIKALFVEAPLWRVVGLDGRLSEELARMALDLAEERCAAHRPVQHELWLALGAHGGARALAALELELAGTHVDGRRAAAIALARAGHTQRLTELARTERDPAVRATMELALRGETTQLAYRALDPRETQVTPRS